MALRRLLLNGSLAKVSSRGVVAWQVRAITLIVDSKVIESYTEDDKENDIISLSTSTGISSSNKLAIRRSEPDAIAGMNLPKQQVETGKLPELVGCKNFRPSRLDNRLVTELCRLLRQGNVAAWEAEDVVRNNGGLLTPYHVCEVLKHYRGNVDLSYAFFKWANLFEGFNHDNFSCNAILKILGDDKRFDEIKNVLRGMDEQMIPKTYITYKTLVHIYVNSGMVEEALEAFHELEDCDLRPSVADYNYFMHKLVTLGYPQMVPMVFKSMRRKKQRADEQSYNIVINSLCKMARMDEAYALFKAMKRLCKPDEYTYAALINGYCKCMNTEITCDLLEEMISKELSPNEAIFNMMMDSHVRAGKFEKVIRIFEIMVRQGCQPDVKSYKLLVESFAEANRIEEAYHFLKTITAKGYTPNLSAYNTLLSRLGRANKAHLALEVLEEMKTKPHLRPDVVTYNIAIDLFGKIGRLDEAWNCYLKMKTLCLPDAFTYNTLIVRLGKAGKVDLCLRLLDEMNRDGLSPDHITYAGLIEGFSRAGKVEAATRYLEDMRASGLAPNAATLDVLINALLKAGKFEVAETLVQELGSVTYQPRKSIGSGRSR